MSKFVRSSERWENGEDVEDEVFYDRGELDFNSNSNTTTNNSSVNILADELAEEHKEKQEQQQQSQVQRRSNTKLHELEHGDPHGMEIMNNKVTLDVHTVMNRTSVTLDDAVKVPVALQLPSRRTMFDVLMHLHNNSSNNSCSGDIEIGNANNDASNSKKRNNNVVMITSSGVIGGINTDSDSPVMFYSEEKEEQIIENETKLRDMNSSDKTEYKRETVKEIPRANDIFDSIEQHGKVQSDNNNIICKSRENKEIMHFDPHVLPESISDFDDSDEESTNTSLHITHSSNNKSINEYNKHTKEMFDNKYNDKKHENNDKFTVQYVLEQEEERGIEKERKVCEGEPDRGANRNSTLECTSSHTSKAHNNRSSVLELFDEQEEVAMQRTSSSAFKANTQSSSPTPTMESNKVSQTIYDLDVMQDNFVDHNSTTQYNLNNNTISDRINDKYSLHHTTSLDTLASSLPHHSAILNSQETPQYVHLQPLSALQSQQATQPILSYYINYTNTMQEETEEYKKNTLTNKNTHGTQPLSSSTEQNVLSTNRMSNSFTKHNRCVNEIGKPVALTLHSLAKRTANNLHSAILSNFTSNKGNNISNSHMSLYMKNIAGNNVTSGANNALHLSTQSSVWSTQPMSQILSTQEFPQPQSELQEEQQQLMLLNYYLLSKPASRFVTTAANINDNNNLSHMNYSQNTWSTQNSIARSHYTSNNNSCNINNNVINDYYNSGIGANNNTNNSKSFKSKMTSERAAQLRLIRQLAQNKTGALVVEYLLCAFKNWVVDGKALRERNNVCSDNCSDAEMDSVYTSLNECGVQLQIRVHRIDYAFHLVQVTGEVINGRHSENVQQLQENNNYDDSSVDKERDCSSVNNNNNNSNKWCTVIVSEQVACVVPFSMGESIYLAQPFWEFSNPSYIILASYNVTSDELIRQQMQNLLLEEEQELLEKEERAKQLGEKCEQWHEEHNASHEGKSNELSCSTHNVEHYLERQQTPKRHKHDLIELQDSNINRNTVDYNNNEHETTTSKNITPYRGGFYDPLIQGQCNQDNSDKEQNIQGDCRGTATTTATAIAKVVTTMNYYCSNSESDSANINANVQAQRSLQFTQEESHENNNADVDKTNECCYYSGSDDKQQSERSRFGEQDVEVLDFYHGPGIEWAVNPHELDALLKQHQQHTENVTQELQREYQ